MQNSANSNSSIISIDGLQLHYRESGIGSVILLLHGWGSNAASFMQLENYLGANFRVIALDLPGFGDSQLPASAWSLGDYVSIVKAFMNEMAIEKPMVVGHSFGGRIAICLGAQNLVSRIILTSSAGVRLPKSLLYYLKVYSYKFAKQLVNCLPEKIRTELLLELQQYFGSSDYKNAHPVLRQILVKVVNEDLSPLLPKINVPTLLIWGENDTTTPLAEAKVMEKNIPDVGLVIIKGAGHYCFLDKPTEFNIIADHFFRN
jgi:pimeloyl-ACP methyl ester carboxylesterase